MKQLEVEGKADICFVVSSLLGWIGLPGPKKWTYVTRRCLRY